MAKLKINTDIINRLNSFLISKSFTNQLPTSKTKYWEHHSKKVKFQLYKSEIDISGESGFDIPDKKNSYIYFSRKIKDLIKKIINYKQHSLLTWEQAFDEVLNDRTVKGILQTKFDFKKIIAKDYSECKKIYPFKKYAINHRSVISYYFLNILYSYTDLERINNVLEIGAGSGTTLALLKKHNNTKCLVDIDLPETLVHCIAYINSIFPDKNFLLPNEIKEKITNDMLSYYDFIFLTPGQVDLLPDNSFDLFLNTSSFQEMQKKEIQKYFNLIQKLGRNGSFFFNHNSVEKIPYDSEKELASLRSQYEPVRFFEYPFFDNEVLIYEICGFMSLVQNSPMYLRLEKIKK